MKSFFGIALFAPFSLFAEEAVKQPPLTDNKTFAAIIGVLLAFLAKEWWSATLIRHKRKLAFGLLIQELEKNVSLMDQIIREGQKVGGKRTYPFYRLETTAQDFLLKDIENYSTIYGDLISELAGLYFELRLINKSLDFAFQHISSSKRRAEGGLLSAMLIADYVIPRSKAMVQRLKEIKSDYKILKLYAWDSGEFVLE